MNNGDVLEHIFFCEPLKIITKAKDAIGSICKDIAPTMPGNRFGFAAFRKKQVPEVRVAHCLFHCYALATKTLPKDLKDVLSACMKIVNSVSGRSLNHRLCQTICGSTDSEETILLDHTEVK